MENKEEIKKEEIKTLKNRALMNKLLEAENVGSFLVCITIRDKSKVVSGGDLQHTFFTQDFSPDDFYPCLDEYAKLLEKEKINKDKRAIK